jgi:beta-N-acetylhexosaminidase
MSVSFSRRTLLTSGLTAAALGASASAAHAGSGHGGGGHGGEGWLRARLRRMSLREKIGQLFIQHVYGPDPEADDERNVPLYGVASPAEVVRKYHLGGVCYFAWTDSVQNPDQIVALSNGLQRAALGRGKKGLPLQITIDQEGGVVTRIGPPATQFPGAMALGAGRRGRDASSAAKITGTELAAMGINTNFAPVCDVNVNPLNPVIGTRSFSSDPGLASEMVTAQVTGYQRDGNVSAAAKHFPGHGDTDVDSHVAFPVINHTREEWEEIDAPPFRAAIDAGIDMIMTAHLAFPALDDSGDPATLSHAILTGVLREELGFDGVIVTDSLEMEGVRELYSDGEVAVRALLAGADQLLMTPAMDEAFEAVTEAVSSGRMSRAELDRKVLRVLRLKQRRGLLRRPVVDADDVAAVVGIPAHLRVADDITDRTTTVVRNDDGVLPFAADGATVVVTGTAAATQLAAGLDAAGATTRLVAGSNAPTDAVIAEAVAAAADADLVVVATMKAWDTTTTDPGGRQQRLVAELVATGTDVVVVATRDPYDVASLPDARSYLATYSFSPVALSAAVRVLVGDTAPSGTLPVDIPTADDPDTVLYPFGHGLTW